jgi:hypothetical protein
MVSDNELVIEVQDTLAYLTGTWTLSRAIIDHVSRVSGAFNGHAQVLASGRRARYEERGRLRFGSYDSRAQRALDLIGTDGGWVAVRFTDGRPFFDLDLTRATCRAVHQCSRDRYELEFRIKSPRLLVERWRVRGPEKDYEARTTWRRT